MAAKLKNLRRPIIRTINGERCSLLTTGYMVRAIGKSEWTLRSWTKIGLLPPAPFVLHPEHSNRKRNLFPAPYVKRLGEICRQDYVVRRLEREDWERFYTEIWDAYDELVRPFLDGFTGSSDSAET